MSALKQEISAQLKAAMRAKEKARVTLIRTILAECKKVEVDERIELDDTRVLAILDKMVKQRKESVKQFIAGDRPDLAEVENAEIAILQDFLPQALTEAELQTIIEQAIKEIGATSMQEMGNVMALVKPQVQGRGDMGQVSKLVKSILG